MLNLIGHIKTRRVCQKIMQAKIQANIKPKKPLKKPCLLLHI